MPSKPSLIAVPNVSLPHRIVDVLLEGDAEDFVSSYASSEDREGGHPLSHQPANKKIVRAVRFSTGHTLFLWETGRRGDYGRRYLGYRFLTPAGKILFQGDEFSPGAVRDPYSDDSINSIMLYLTLQSGDTDKEFFDKYTPDQLAWASSAECEQISGDIGGCDGFEDGYPAPWRDLPGFEYKGDES